jgi:RNA recognition motif-containing protein
VVPFYASNLNVCLNNNDTDVCESSFNRRKFYEVFSKMCIGKKKCDIDSFKDNFIFPVYKNCNSDESVAFYQYTCQHSQEQLSLKRLQGLAIVCFNILIGLVFLIMLRFFKKKTQIELKQWDMDTVTVSDFAVELNIPVKMYDRFKEDFEEKVRLGQVEDHNPDDYSLIFEFEYALCQSIENDISKIPKINKDLDEVIICDVNINFNNSEIINLLSKRGTALKYGKILEARKVEDEIKELKEKKYDSLIKPKSAFIVFEEEEAAIRALSTNNTLKFYDKKLKFVKPAEPSDIIWENRHASKRGWIFRTAVASLVIFLIMVGTFLLIMFLKTWTTKVQYGDMNCETLRKFYPNNQILQKNAIKEYLTLIGEKSQSTVDGALKCLCTQEKLKFGYTELYYKEYSDPGILNTRREPIKARI